MPDSAIRPHRRPLFLPSGHWECQIRPALRIDRLGKRISQKFALRYYSEFCLVNYLKSADDTFAFEADMVDDAIVCGEWFSKDAMPLKISLFGEEKPFSLVLPTADKLIECFSEKTTLKTGDIIILPYNFFTYIPLINKSVSVSDDKNEILLDFTIK